MLPHFVCAYIKKSKMKKIIHKKNYRSRKSQKTGITTNLQTTTQT